MSKKNKNKNRVNSATVNTTVNNNVKGATKDSKVTNPVDNAKSTKPVNEPAKTVKTEPKVNIPEPPVVETAIAKLPSRDDINSILDVMKNTSNSGLSADSYVTLAGIMDDKYRKDPGAKDKYSATFLDGTSRLVDVIVFGTLIEQVVNTTTPMALLIRKASYPQLQNLASTFGIKLPSADKLRLPTAEELSKSGITQPTGEEALVDVNPSDVSKETSDEIKKEAKDVAKTVELNPQNIKNLDMLKDALNYIYKKRDGRKIEKCILQAIRLVKDYRYNELEFPEYAKTKDERKAALDSRTIDDWLTDTAAIAEPTLLFRQIGSVLATTISNEKCPMGAFLSMRAALTYAGECSLSDAEVAAITKFLVIWYDTYVRAENEDKLKKKLTDTQRSVIQKELDVAKAAMIYLTKIDKNIIEDCNNVYHPDASAVTKKLYYFTRSVYFGKEMNTAKLPKGDVVFEAHFKNLQYNVIQKIGVIANLFLPINDRFDCYSEANIKPLEASTDSDGKSTDDKTSDDKSGTSKPTEDASKK